MRRVFFVFLLLGCGAFSQGAEPAAAPPPPASPTLPKPVVFTATDPGAVVGFDSDSAAERRLVDQLVLAVTGARDLRTAWSSLVGPGDFVGLKVSAVGGRLFSTHHGVVSAVVSGVESAGVPASRILIWDRRTEDLRDAGFIERRGGPMVRGIDPPRGFDPQAKIVAPMLGQLIWGDLGFRGRETGMRRMELEQSQVSSESHLPKLLTQLTKIINLPTFSDERGCGVAGALYNMTVPNLDNSRRFLQATGASSICDAYADPRLGGKVALTIVDGMVAQYAAGPAFNPNYAFAYRTLLASKDPVALDSTMLRRIEGWRKQANLPALDKTGAWIEDAEILGLGTFAQARITVQAVGWP